MNENDETGWGRWLLEELGHSHVWDLLWDSALWAVLGSCLGLLLGLVGFFALRRLGGFRWEWLHAKWLRGLTAVLLIGLWTAAGGAIGLIQGALYGGETVLRKSQLATEAFPAVADAGADLLAYVALTAPLAAKGQQPGPAEDAKLEAFRRGEWELDAVTLLDEAGAVSAAVAEQHATELEASVLAKFPSWKGGRMQGLLHGALTALCGLLVEEAIDEELDKLGEPGRLAKRLVMRLPDAAAAEGDPRTISRAQLSAHLIQEGIVPAILIPVRQLARGQQLTALVLALICTLVPVVLFRLAEFLRTRSTQPVATDAPSADAPAADAPAADEPSADAPAADEA